MKHDFSNAKVIRDALASFDRPSADKGGRRLFDEFAENLISLTADPRLLEKALEQAASVALGGPPIFIRALSSALSQLSSCRDLATAHVRHWLKDRLKSDDPDRRVWLLQALTHLGAPPSFIELESETAVLNKFPIIWFNTALIATNMEKSAAIFASLFNSGKMDARVIVARAPAIRQHLGYQAPKFFQRATELIGDEHARREIRFDLDRLYHIGFDEGPIEKPKEVTRLAERLRSPKLQQVVRSVIEARTISSRAA